ncbi:hypothetical protein HNR42_000784 [Deinobacterium chartae]|uniref:Lipoprotein n=1 Tax=Deinobacterium chartae TaxID=521158 RepID=A0A841HYS4_9DEIO|nr:hypothetical protein [Deinobacterium chartae]MBB6097370.1 hypothetical protein [Deinobacterium chartae]
MKLFLAGALLMALVAGCSKSDSKVLTMEDVMTLTQAHSLEDDSAPPECMAAACMGRSEFNPATVKLRLGSELGWDREESDGSEYTRTERLVIVLRPDLTGRSTITVYDRTQP